MVEDMGERHAHSVVGLEPLEDDTLAGVLGPATLERRLDGGSREAIVAAEVLLRI